MIHGQAFRIITWHDFPKRKGPSIRHVMGTFTSTQYSKPCALDYNILCIEICAIFFCYLTIWARDKMSPFAKFYFKYGYIFDIFIYENIDKNFDKLEI